jgi:signal transduction histidine kinase
LLSDREVASLVERLGVEPQRTGGVLLVDDEELNLRALRAFLEDRWQVHVATSGAEGLDIAAKVPLDVVVADQRMPGMTGLDMLEELRRRRPDIAGIVLTAFADMQALESAINRAAVFRFLRKPSHPAEIIQAIEQASALVVQRRTIEKLVQLLAKRSDELRASLDEVQAQQQMLLHLERLGTLGRLTAGITHDLRSVMVAFRAAEWEFANTPAIPDGLREIVTLGLAGVENMQRTLQTLHEFVRTGSLSLDLRDVDPATIVTDALSIAKMDPAFKLHVVRSDVPRDLPRVRADRQKLIQVVVNLVRNALHATRPDEGVRVIARASPAGGVQLAVEDDGPGVAPEIRSRLFQPFASAKGDKGLGLGLYMARLIAVAHRGGLELVDILPRGARFEVTLPPPEAAQAAAAGPHLTPIPQTQALSRPGSTALRED